MSKRFYYRLLAFSIFLFLGGGCWLWWTSSSRVYIPVRIDDYWNVPLVQMEIGKKNYQVKLDFAVDLTTLNRRELREIDRQQCGIHTTLDGLGACYERTMYEVSGVKIHGLKVPKMEIHETPPAVILFGDPKEVSYCGSIGRRVFDGKNYLLDLAHSRIIICKHFEDLARDGYDLKSFIDVPFEVNKAGICLQAETDLGKKILALNPGFFHCFLRPPSEKESLPTEPFYSLQLWRSQQCTLGECAFGPTGFVFFELSPLIDMIDGALGIDFLKEHAVYIDAKKSVAYIGRSPAKSS